MYSVPERLHTMYTKYSCSFTSRLNHCHPERSECFAKRSTHGVEGPHARLYRHKPVRESRPRTIVRMPFIVLATINISGVLRLRFSCAKRKRNSAQDDSVYLTSSCNVLVVSFPKMSITFTTTMYFPGSAYSCATDSSSFGLLRVRYDCH